MKRFSSIFHPQHTLENEIAEKGKGERVANSRARPFREVESNVRGGGSFESTWTEIERVVRDFKFSLRRGGIRWRYF